MKLKTILIVMGMLLPILTVRGQKIKPLNIGDTIPNMTLHNVINHKDSLIRLSDLKDKLVILDFWATWCGSCIKNMPSLFSLAKTDQRVKVFLINSKSTGDSKSRILQFFKLRDNPYKLPCIYEDQLLVKYFPYQLLPHYVWIYNNKIVELTTRAIPTSYDVQNIVSGKYHLQNERTLLLDFNRFLLIPNKSIGIIHIQKQSVFTDKIESLPSNFHINSTNSLGFTHIQSINNSLLDCFKKVYPKLRSLPKNRIQFIDSTDVSNTKFKDSLICYELIMQGTQEKAIEIMKMDLESYSKRKFLYSVDTIDCLKLEVEDRSLLPFTKYEKEGITNIYDIYPSQTYILYGGDLNTFCRKLNELQRIPVLNKTGVNELIDLEWPSNYKDVISLNKVLKKYGLKLSPSSEALPIAYFKTIN